MERTSSHCFWGHGPAAGSVKSFKMRRSEAIVPVLVAQLLDVRSVQVAVRRHLWPLLIGVLAGVAASCSVVVAEASDSNGPVLRPRAQLAVRRMATKRSRTLIVHPAFRRVPGYEFVAASDRYVFITGPPYRSGAGVLVDGRTGHRRTLSRPGCIPSALGGPWLAFTCGQPPNESFQLYNIPSGRSKPFTNTTYQNCRVDCLSIYAVGTDWLALEVPSGDEHILPSFEFQNLKSGQVTADPTNSTTTVDLDSPYLAEKVCRPPTVPAYSDGYSSRWGSLTSDGRYEIAAGSGGAYLERCGSRLHEFLTFTTPDLNHSYHPCGALDCPPAANSHVIVWRSGAGSLGGIFLLSQRRFTIPLPIANEGIAAVAIVANTLYLELYPGGIWSAPVPAAPSSQKSRP